MVNSKKYTNTRRGQKWKFFSKPMSDQERFWTNKFKAVIYTRVSSKWQFTQWNWWETQETICRQWCKNQNWVEIEVVKVFHEEGVSGSNMNRKGMNDSLAFLEEKNKKITQIHYFIVTDADRIARPEWDISEALLLDNKIESTGVKIITVNSKRNTESDEWRLVQNIQYAVAWYERKKIRRRTMDGKYNKMINGGRPFPPAVWYMDSWKGKNSVHCIDPIKWPIIKQWLELYAYNPHFTKSQLHKFRQEKWLQTSKSTGKLYISFIEKTFRDYRLYYYGGYIYYPEWCIDQTIKWLHQGLVSLEVIEKIFEKENINLKKKNKSPNINKDLERHPLKWVLTCSWCWRKPWCYKAKGRGWDYYYYTCTKSGCPERYYIDKETMENEFLDFINKMKLSQWVFNVFKEVILKKWDQKKQILTDSIPQLQWQLLAIKSRISKIEDKIFTVNNEKLIQKLEEERANLDHNKDIIIDKIANKKGDEYDINTTLDQIEPIFTKPVEIRKNSNYEIRQLLSMVRFSWILYYKKNQWHRTTDTKGLYYIFSPKWDTNTRGLPGMGLEPTHIAAPDFESSVSTNSTTLAQYM